jgi:adenylate kinase
METRTIFFFGKPGCGKGDQAKLLSDETGWKILSSGNDFRAMSAEHTPVGRKIKEINDAGLLQPYWLAEYLFLKNLFSLTENESVIFDGFGRKIPEAEFVIESLAWINRPFLVLHLKVSDEEIKKRLALRKELQGRADDHVVDERLKEYYEYTDPVIELFKKAGTLIEINGEQTREAIAEDIKKILNLPSTGS